MAQGFWHGGPSNVAVGLEGPAHSPALNDWWPSNVPGLRADSRLRLVLGVWGSTFKDLGGQTPCEGLLGGRPKVRVSPQVVVRHNPMAVQ